jgi:hypothetical protein
MLKLVPRAVARRLCSACVRLDQVCAGNRSLFCRALEVGCSACACTSCWFDEYGKRTSLLLPLAFCIYGCARNPLSLSIEDSFLRSRQLVNFLEKVNCHRISDRPRSRLHSTEIFEDFEAILYEFFHFPTEIR